MTNLQNLENQLDKLNSVLLSFDRIDRELKNWTGYFDWVKTPEGIAKRLTQLQRVEKRFHDSIEAFEGSVDLIAISRSLAHRDRKPVQSRIGLSAMSHTSLFIREAWVVFHQFREWLSAIRHWFEDATAEPSFNPAARTDLSLIERLATHDYGSPDEFDDDRSRLFKGTFWKMLSAQHVSWAKSGIGSEFRDLVSFVRNELELCNSRGELTEERIAELAETMKRWADNNKATIEAVQSRLNAAKGNTEPWPVPDLEWLGPEAEHEGKGKASNSKKHEKKRRGREPADEETIRREAEIADAWKRAHEADAYKPDWAKENGFESVKEFDNLLDRVYRRKKREADKQNQPPTNSN